MKQFSWGSSESRWKTSLSKGTSAGTLGVPFYINICMDFSDCSIHINVNYLPWHHSFLPENCFSFQGVCSTWEGGVSLPPALIHLLPSVLKPPAPWWQRPSSFPCLPCPVAWETALASFFSSGEALKSRLFSSQTQQCMWKAAGVARQRIPPCVGAGWFSRCLAPAPILLDTEAWS